MKIKFKNILYWFLLPALIGMAFPYVFVLSDNTFIKDFLAKRIMFLFTLPATILFAIIFLLRLRLPVKNEQKLGAFFYFLFLTVQIGLCLFLHSNGFSYAFLDIYLLVIPAIIFFLINYADEVSLVKIYRHVFILSFLLGVLSVKLQYSYIGLLAFVFFIFFLINKHVKFRLIYFVPLLFSGPLIYHALLGKNALILFFVSVSLGLIAFRGEISYFPKLFSISLVFFFVMSVTLVVHPGLIYGNATYRHFSYFLVNFNPLEQSYDSSTGNRIYEAYQVLERFSGSRPLEKIFGFGPGASLDLSGTPDVTVINAHAGATQVRYIHLLFFALLYRYGILGLVLFYGFFIVLAYICIFNILRINKYIIKSQERDYIKWASIYVLLILWDGQISSGHLLSNYLFWASAFFVLNARSRMFCQAGSRNCNLKVKANDLSSQ